MYRLPQHNQSEKKKSRILLSFRNVWSWAGFWKGTQRRQGKETLSAENRPEGGIAERPLNQCCAEPGRSENDQIQTRAVAGRSILHRAIMDFVSSLEDDSELGFRIEDFHMVPATDGTNLQATFSVTGIRVKVENTTASVNTTNTTEQNAEDTNTNDNNTENAENNNNANEAQ